MSPAEVMAERRRSELVAQERSGHTAVVEDNLLYVWGGYVVNTVLLYILLLYLYCYYSMCCIFLIDFYSDVVFLL